MTSDEYKKAFGLQERPNAEIEKALQLAHEIRKFEIDLYWKRATYFSAFLAVTLAGYFTLLTAKEVPRDEKGEALLIVSCLGVVFSVAWYFVNRASKFWQENWEKHVDLHEEAVTTPLYKTVLSDADLSFWKWWGPYPFSVSKLNQILSLFVTLLFLLLAATTLSRYYEIGCPPDSVATMMVILTIAAVTALCWKGRAKPTGVNRVRAKRRTTEIV